MPNSVVSTGTRAGLESRASSNGSGRVANKTTYRVLSRTSDVDESLFGGSTAASKADIKKPQKDSKAAKGRSSKHEDSDTVILTASDLARMKTATTILSPAEMASLQSDRDAEKARERADAYARKAAMLKMEEERKKREPLTETERLKQEMDHTTLNTAAYKLDEELDDVKTMNRMMLYAKCVTIRDKQRGEKVQRKEEEEEENRRLDAIMEEDRVKAIRMYEERERARLEELKLGKKIIEKQIMERELERRRQEEIRDQEGQQIVAQIERLKAEELQQVQERREAGQRLMAEVQRSNAEAIERKKAAAQAEKEDDDRIREYLRQKDIREQAFFEEQERIKHERELETARLRGMQEKAKDRQAELDNLRAQRTQEAYEREWREKERAEAERLARMNEELRAAREQQKVAKMKQLADQAKVEEAEFYRVIAAQRELEKQEKIAAEAHARKQESHKNEIQSQIRRREEQRKKERQEYLEEGERLRRRAAEQKAKLEAIKARKLVELREEGVPEKYRAELERKKIAL